MKVYVLMDYRQLGRDQFYHVCSTLKRAKESAYIERMTYRGDSTIQFCIWESTVNGSSDLVWSTRFEDGKWLDMDEREEVSA